MQPQIVDIKLTSALSETDKKGTNLVNTEGDPCGDQNGGDE